MFSIMKKQLFLTHYESPVWKLTLWVIENQLCLLTFDVLKRKDQEINEVVKYFGAEIRYENHPLSDETIRQLHEYFTWKRKNFDIPLLTFGTDFQKKSWQALQTIAYGTTWSYKQEAEKVGSPQAVRAVGSANGRNRIAIIIPCHRVIGKSGNLSGFGGGIEKKKFLLELEGSFRG